MDMLRGILIGLGCFGLLIVGSCTMLSYGTMAVIGKAAEVAQEEQNNPARKAAREAAIDRTMEDFAREAEQRAMEREYSSATDSDYSDFGKPTNDLETKN
jgi:hypothetical protein